jgi:hypothetical protein
MEEVKTEYQKQQYLGSMWGNYAKESGRGFEGIHGKLVCILIVAGQQKQSIKSIRGSDVWACLIRIPIADPSVSVLLDIE